MKKQLLFVVAVLGVQNTQTVSGAIIAVMTGQDRIKVENINDMPNTPKTMSIEDIYDVKCQNGGRVTAATPNGDETDKVSIFCKGCAGTKGHCVIRFKETGKYVLTQKLPNGTIAKQHINVVEKAKKAKKQKRSNQ